MKPLWPNFYESYSYTQETNSPMALWQHRFRDLSSFFPLYFFFFFLLMPQNLLSIMPWCQHFVMMTSTLMKSVACFDHTISLARCPSKASAAPSLNPQSFYEQRQSITDVFGLQILCLARIIHRPLIYYACNKLCFITQVDLFAEMSWEHASLLGERDIGNHNIPS